MTYNGIANNCDKIIAFLYRNLAKLNVQAKNSLYLNAFLFKLSKTYYCRNF